MRDETKAAPTLFAAALMGAVIFQAVFAHTAGIGPNAFLVVAFAVAAAWALAARKDVALQGYGWLGVIPMGVGSLGLAFNDSNGLDAVNLGLIFLGAGVCLVASLRGQALSLAEGLIVGPFLSVMSFAVGVVLPFITRWGRIRTEQLSPTAKSVLAGSVLTLPILILFGYLLGSADPSFSRLFAFQLNLDYEEISVRVLLMGAGFLLVGGWFTLLSPSLQILSPTVPPTIQGEEAEKPTALDHGALYCTVMGLISLLFVLFLGVQAANLFRGDSYILQTEGMTYAQYARRGFFEISAVTAICIPILIAGQVLVKPKPGRSKFFGSWITTGLCALLALLLVSAAHRMSLYVDAYGLPPLRLQVTAGMVFMAIIIGASAWLGFGWRLSRMAYPVLAAACIVGLALNIARPDYLIAKVNLAKEERVDWTLLSTLGADAWPVIRRQPEEKQEAWIKSFTSRSHSGLGASISEQVVPIVSIAPKGAVPAKRDPKDED